MTYATQPQRSDNSTPRRGQRCKVTQLMISQPECRLILRPKSEFGLGSRCLPKMDVVGTAVPKAPFT